MKDTGIVRRVDGLGRIVIPKEIRKNIKIKEGDPLEFYTDRGELILRKYSPLEDNEEFLSKILTSLTEVIQKECIITDLDRVILATETYKSLENKSISDTMQKVLTEKKSVNLNLIDGYKDFNFIKGEQQFDAVNIFVMPIVCDSQLFGGIIIPSKDGAIKEEDLDVKSIRVCAKIIARHFIFE